MSDPWLIVPLERKKHDEQFKSIGPVAGYITGEQAKGFFLQSRLPPQVLGVIWMLSDLDGDGKMNQNEFSIACKLINMKLRGFNLPQALPPSLKQSALMPQPVITAMPAAIPSAYPASVPSGFQANFPPIGSVIPPLVPTASLIGGAAPVASVGPMSSTIAPIASVVPIMATSATAQQTPMPLGAISGIGGFSSGVTAAPFVPAAVPIRPVVPVAAEGVAPQPMNSAPKVPIPDPSVEWGVPQATKLKFTQVFNMSDRAKTGFLSGAQARNILIQSALPQQTLATIWAVSDVDNDGRLSCEEFVLAMFLCEQAKAGKVVPTVLPPDLIPPTLRRSRASSIHSQGSTGTPGGDVVLSPTSAQLILDDKRRENYEKGQAELERRRKALLDAQRRETEERLRREREEEMKREKARQEAERKRQEELEREMQMQREIEAQKEAERKRFEETKEQARKEAERQRQDEWEKQRLLELMNVRQRQQENLLALKAKNQTLTIDLSTKEEKVKELTQRISETRVGVTEVKATIDSMRSTRDNHMSNMNSLKAQARDQNQRLLNLNQEKARLKARSLASAGASGAETAVVEASVTSKQMVIRQLQEKIQELENEISTKEEDVNNNITEFESVKEQFQLTGERCNDLYEEFSSKRKEVMALREKLLNPDAAWGDTGGSTWSEAEKVPIADGGEHRRFKALYQFEARNGDELSFAPGDIIVVVPSEGAEPGWLSGNLNNKNGWFPEAYCEQIEDGVLDTSLANEVPVVSGLTDAFGAVPLETKPQVLGEVISIYTWAATRNNYLSFDKGEKIIVREKLDDWIYGELKGIGGWFPKTYVKGTASPTTTPIEAPEVPPISQYLDHDDISQYYVSVYPYQSDETGDLPFEAGETILVVKKDGDWWFGISGEKNGIFPSNYVQLSPTQLMSAKDQPEVVTEAAEAVQPEVPKGEPVQEKAVEELQPLEEGVMEEPGSEPKEETKEAEVEEERTAKVISVVSPPESASLRVNQDDEAENKEVAELMQKSPRSPKGKSKKQLEVAQVIAPYDATSANQLSLARGQLVSIRKKTASGWWEGELHARGKKRQIGWFPASYVKIKCGSSRTTPVSMEMSGKDEYPPADFTPGAFETAFNKNVMKVSPKINAPPPLDPETVEALYPYMAVNDDELTFEPGDLIFVLDKEDSAWWKGSLRGVIGVFPSNYVQPKSEAKIASKPAAVNASVTSPEGEDSLCYSNKANAPLENGFWNVREETKTQERRDKRFTTYECFNSVEEETRQNVIHEIIKTESSYLEDLLLVQRAFITPMRNSKVISSEEVGMIFINWNELVNVSSSFNKALSVRLRNTGRGSIHMISDILCQQISQLHPYMRFCSLQSRGSVVLNKKFQENGPFADFISSCEENPEVSSHRLTFFLLKPLQRLTKYPLLIKNLLAYTPQEHPDYQNTVDALQVATTLCEQVNEAVRQQDNTDKLEWMQKRIQCENLAEPLIFNSLTNTLHPRKLLHMGLLHKTKSKKEIIAFLLSDFLLLTTANKTIGTTTSLMNFEQLLQNNTCTMYREPMFLSEVTVRLDRDQETAFIITANKIDLSFSSNTVNERNNWVRIIGNAKKIIRDLEKAQHNNSHIQENDSNVVGRVLISVVGGVDLISSSDVRGRSPKGMLNVRQLKANLEVGGRGLLQSFCEVSLGSQVHRTKVSTSTHPKWNQAMQFRIKSFSEDVLCITVFEKGFFRPNEFLGRVEIRVQKIYESCGENPEPKIMKLPLQEVSKGEVILKTSLQLYK